MITYRNTEIYLSENMLKLIKNEREKNYFIYVLKIPICVLEFLYAHNFYHRVFIVKTTGARSNISKILFFFLKRFHSMNLVKKKGEIKYGRTGIPSK